MLIHSALKDVADEMYRMLEHDLAKYPVDDGKKKSKKRKKTSSSVAMPNLQQFSDSDMERARQMVQIEASLSGGMMCGNPKIPQRSVQSGTRFKHAI